MKPEKTMTEKVEELREAGAQWNEVAKAIGSPSGPAAMKRFQHAKKIGPYSKPRSRKPKKPLSVISRKQIKGDLFHENNDPNASIKKGLRTAIDEATKAENAATYRRTALEQALDVLEAPNV